MKRIISIMCLAALVAALLCGCMQKTSELKNDVATVASEAENRLDDMIEDGTVRDGDGYVGDSEKTDDDRSKNDMTRGVTEDVTDATSYDDGVFGSEPMTSDSSEFI